MNSEQWLKERTFHHTNFWDLKWLVEEKERQGLTISLCLPALNEEKTIGKEINQVDAVPRPDRRGHGAPALLPLGRRPLAQLCGG